MIKYLRCFHIELEGILIKNSPYYHVVPFDSQYGYIHDLEIFVDTEGQIELCRLFGDCNGTRAEGKLPFEIPTFPLNTDGIDIWSKDFLIERVKITNFDDAIVPKPST